MKRRVLSVLFALVLGAAFVLGRVSTGNVAPVAAAEALRAGAAVGAPPGVAVGPGGGGCVGRIVTTNVSNFEFVPSTSDTQYRNTANGLESHQDHATFFAPFSLPGGACFANVTFHVRHDSLGFANLAVAYNWPTAGSTTRPDLASGDTQSVPQDVGTHDVVLPVSAPVYSEPTPFYLRVEIRQSDGGIWVQGAQVTYTVPVTYVPGVQK